MSRPRSRIARCAGSLLLAAFCVALSLFAPPALAVITYVASSAAPDSSGSLLVVLPVPAGTVTNDLMLVAISVKPGITLTAPAGWTLIRSDVGPDPNQYAFYKFRALGEAVASYTFTFSGSSQGAGGMMVFRGVDLASPIEASSGASVPAGPAQSCKIGGKNVNVDPMQAPYLGSPGAQYLPTQGALLVGFFSNGQDKTNISPPPLITSTSTCIQDAAGTPAWTETIQRTSGGAGAGFTLEGSYQPTLCGVSGANCTGTRTAYATNNTGNADIAQMFALRPVQLLNHYYVTNNATGVNCQEEAVTIVAHDSAHNPVVMSAGSVITVVAQFVSGAGGANKGDWSIVSGGGSINNATADDGVATYTFPGGTSSVVLALKDTWVQTVNIAVSDGAVTDETGTASVDVGYNQNLSFVNSGLRITDGGATPAPATIATQTAGTPSATYGLQAIRTDTSTGACLGVFTSGTSVAVELASQCNNPIACIAGQNVSITNNAVSATIASNPNSAVTTYTTRNLLFGANSQALFTLNYPDVGAISLYARYQIPLGTGAGSGNFMTGSSNQFVVKPADFTLSNIQQTAAPNLANPGAADATGAKFIKAGEAFSVTVTARNAVGGATPNYGHEITPETVRLTGNLAGGLGLTNNPSIANATAFGSFIAGVATGTTFSWTEVGIIALTPSVGDADYLGAGNVTGSASGNVGRFYPDHFALSPGAVLINRSTSSCLPASNFTYMNEPMSLAFNLTAQGPAPGSATLLNYVTSATPANNFAKLATATPIPAAFGFGLLNGTTDLSARLDPSLGIVGSWLSGVLSNATATLAFSRNAVPDGPYAALRIGLAPTDSDGVQLLSGDFDMDVTAPVGNDHAQAAQTQVRFGRLRLGNAFGSELLDLPIPMETQYLNSSGVYVTNVDDSCTAIALSNVYLSSGAATGGGTFVQGKGNLKINKPLAKVSIDLCVDLDVNVSTQNDSSCISATPAAKPWLQWKWSGSTFDKDPKARATFDVFKNTDQFIYLRENF